MRVLLIKENKNKVITQRYYHKVDKMIFFQNMYLKIKYFDKFGNYKEDLLETNKIVGIEVVEENE